MSKKDDLQDKEVADAWKEIKGNAKRSRECWWVIGHGCVRARKRCLALTNDDDIDSYIYKEAFGAWKKKAGISDIKDPNIHILFKCMERLGDIQKWLIDVVDEDDRSRWNAPNTIWRHFEAYESELKAKAKAETGADTEIEEAGVEDIVGSDDDTAGDDTDIGEGDTGDTDIGAPKPNPRPITENERIIAVVPVRETVPAIAIDLVFALANQTNKCLDLATRYEGTKWKRIGHSCLSTNVLEPLQRLLAADKASLAATATTSDTLQEEVEVVRATITPDMVADDSQVAARALMNLLIRLCDAAASAGMRENVRAEVKKKLLSIADDLDRQEYFPFVQTNDDEEE